MDNNNAKQKYEVRVYTNTLSSKCDTLSYSKPCYSKTFAELVFNKLFEEDFYKGYIDRLHEELRKSHGVGSFGVALCEYPVIKRWEAIVNNETRLIFEIKEIA